MILLIPQLIFLMVPQLIRIDHEVILFRMLFKFGLIMALILLVISVFLIVSFWSVRPDHQARLHSLDLANNRPRNVVIHILDLVAQPESMLLNPSELLCCRLTVYSDVCFPSRLS